MWTMFEISHSDAGALQRIPLPLALHWSLRKLLKWSVT